MKKLLIKRFLSFILQKKKSEKLLPKQLLRLIKNDTRSITGGNLRRILLLVKRSKVEEISKEDIENIEHAKLNDEEYWRVNLLREITNMKFGQVAFKGFSNEECKKSLQFACTS